MTEAPRHRIRTTNDLSSTPSGQGGCTPYSVCCLHRLRHWVIGPAVGQGLLNRNLFRILNPRIYALRINLQRCLVSQNAINNNCVGYEHFFSRQKPMAWKFLAVFEIILIKKMKKWVKLMIPNLKYPNYWLKWSSRRKNNKKEPQSGGQDTRL